MCDRKMLDMNSEIARLEKIIKKAKCYLNKATNYHVEFYVIKDNEDADEMNSYICDALDILNGIR